MNSITIKFKRGLLSAFVIILLITIRDCLNYSIPFTVFSIVTIMAAIICNREERFFVLFTLLPFSRGLPYSEMILELMIIEILDSLIIKKNRKVDAKLYLPIFVVIIVELLDYFKYDINSIEIVYIACYMLVASYVIDQRVFKNSAETTIYGYALGTVYAVVLVIIREVQEHGLDYIFVYNVRFGTNTEERSVTNFNANELALYCIIAICLLLTIRQLTRKKIPFVLAVAVSALGLVSVSRTYLLLLILCWGIYLIQSKSSIRTAIAIAGGFCAVIIVSYALIPDFVKWLQEYFISRSQTSGGRLSLFVDYFNISFSNIWSAFFGYSSSYPNVLNTTAAHNGFQEIIVCWGIVGFSACFNWIYLLVRKASQLCYDKTNNRWLSFAMFLLFIQSIQFFTMYAYLLVMVMSLVVFEIRGDVKDEARIRTADSF